MISHSMKLGGASPTEPEGTEAGIDSSISTVCRGTPRVSGTATTGPENGRSVLTYRSEL